MERNELKIKVKDIAKKYPLSVVATVSENKPFARYMMLACDDGLNFYSATSANSRKVKQIQSNSSVCAVMGADVKNMALAYINIYGRAEILTDMQTKKKMWCSHLEQYFKGPDDPDYVVLKIKPNYIECHLPGKMTPEVLRF